MKTLRWIASFPVALVLSIIAWFVLASILRGAHGGADLITRAIGYAPIIFRSSIPTAVFVISAVMLSPSQGRKVAFIFFGVSIVISGGGLESLQYYQLGIVEFWVASFVGVIIGALAGLLIALRLQDRRARKTSRQLSESTSGLVPGRGSL